MDKTYGIGTFAKRIGRPVQTVRRQEREGQLTAKRLPSGHRYFDESDVRRLIGSAPENRLTVVDGRVSSVGQKNDLAAQVEAMETYCRHVGIAVDEWVQEMGGGMSFKRKPFLDILNRIQRGEIKKLRVAHQDRLARFGYDRIAHRASENGCAVVNQNARSPQQDKAPQEFLQ